MTQVLHIITNKSIFINNFKIELDLLYTNTPLGVGGKISHINLFHSNIGLEDQNFQDLLNL